MQKSKVKIKNLFLMGVILLLAAGAAQAVTIPSKSVVNPLTETVYAPANPDNAAGRIRVYQRTENIIKGWKEETGKTIYMPSPTAKIFGLAVSADGTKLYVSVSNSYLSKLRVINLDASGLPTGSAPYFDYSDASWTAGTYDSPTGLAVAENPATGLERVYMTDSANQIHYFDQNPAGSWSLTGNITEGLTGMGNIYDVVIGPVQQDASSMQYLIIVSRKAAATTPNKKLFVYQYSWTAGGGETISLVKTIDTTYAITYMKVVGSTLYAAVKDVDGDIKAYNIVPGPDYLTEFATIRSGLSETPSGWGWSGLAVRPDGSALYYTQAQNAAETTTKLYKVTLPVSGGYNDATPLTTTIRADGLVAAPDGARLAVTYSGDGSLQNIDDSVDGDLKFLPPTFETITPNSTTYGVPVEVVINGNNFINAPEIKTQAWLSAPSPSPYLLENIVIQSSSRMTAHINGVDPEKARVYGLKLGNGDAFSVYPGVFTINFNKPQNLRGYASDLSSNPLLGGQIRWVWDANNEGEDQYDLLDQNGQAVKTVSLTTVTEDSLSPNVQYSRRLRVSFGGNPSAVGDLVSVYSSAAAPSISTITADITPSVSLTLATGGNPNPGTKYEIWKKNGGPYALVATVEVPACIDNNVSNGVTYTYRARALNGDNQPSRWSAEKTATVPSPNRAPNDPTNLKQYKSDGSTEIPDGGRTNDSTTVFKFDISDPDGSASNPVLLAPAVRIDGGAAAYGNGELYSGGAAVVGTVTVNNITEGIHTWEAMVSDEAGLSSAWVTGETFIVDTAAPTVLSTTPTNGATGVALNSNITATFSENMDQASLTGANFTVTQNGSPKAKSITYEAATRTVTLDPVADFANGSTVEVTVNHLVSDLAGNPLAADYKFSFIAGTIEGINIIEPRPGVVWFAGKTFDITWNSAGNIPNVKIELSTNGGAAWNPIINSTPNTGSYTWNIPSSTVAENCRIRISDAVDSVPSALSQQFYIRVDNDPPQLLGTYPASNETGVANDVTMVATFEDEYGINPGTVNANTIRIDNHNVTNVLTSATGSVGHIITTIKFNSADLFSNSEVVNVHLTGGIKDWATNSISDYSWSFTVGTPSASPTVTSIDPNNGIQGQTVTVVNLIGTNFASGASVKLAKSGQPDINATNVQVASPTHITCAIPLPLGAQIGTWDVTVTNTDNRSGSLVNGFTIYAAPGTAPVVSGINPDTGTRGNHVTSTITGDKFVDGATAYLAKTGQSNISGNVTFVSGTSLTFNVDLPANAQVGLWSVIVTNPDTQQGVLYNGFSIVSDPATIPTVTNIYPRRAPSTEATDIRIIGTNFAAGNTVDIQTNPALSLQNVFVNSPTMISATVPAGITPAGVYHITVTNGSGTSVRTAADTFEVMGSNEVPPTASMIKDFNATDGEDGRSTLSWTNPSDNDMATVEIRRYPSAFPAAYDPSGTLVYSDIPAPGTAVSTVDASLTNGNTYYYVSFIRDTSGNWSAVDSTTPEVNANTGIPQTGGATGEATFPITYLSETQAENWISVPFSQASATGTALNTVGDLFTSLLGTFTAQTGDIATLNSYANAGQTPTSIMRDYDGSQWNSWDPENQPLQTGTMYILNISNSAGRPNIAALWTISGNIPASGSVTFPISYLSETQAENWISKPNEASLTDKGSIMTSLSGKFTPQTGDILSMSWYNNATQTITTIMRDYDGTQWNSWDAGKEAELTALGDPYKVNLSNSAGRPTFTVNWP